MASMRPKRITEELSVPGPKMCIKKCRLGRVPGACLIIEL